ncbi:MAG TPA: hypothetical protein VEA60_09360 [Allosphingosinicella sp.]|nr:hypothetical protein [Allosphingosinicella sp.]
MMKRLAFALLAPLAACAAEPAPEPEPDPALVERLAEAASPDAPALPEAERLAAALDRSDPDRLANAAEGLLAR